MAVERLEHLEYLTQGLGGGAPGVGRMTPPAPGGEGAAHGGVVGDPGLPAKQAEFAA